MCENSLGNKNKNKNKIGQVQTLGLKISSPCWNPHLWQASCDNKHRMVHTWVWKGWGSGGAREGREGVLFLSLLDPLLLCWCWCLPGWKFLNPNSNNVSKQKHALTIVRSYSPFQLTKVPIHCLCYPHESLMMTVR